jgi:hypothetical protein
VLQQNEKTQDSCLRELEKMWKKRRQGNLLGSFWKVKHIKKHHNHPYFI